MRYVVNKKRRRERKRKNIEENVCVWPGDGDGGREVRDKENTNRRERNTRHDKERIKIEDRRRYERMK